MEALINRREIAQPGGPLTSHPPSFDRAPAVNPRTQKTASIVIGAVGLALLLMMIAVEGEFGALPLALLLIGAVGYITGRMRER